MKSNKQRIEELLNKMTLDEKIAQIGSYWYYMLQTNAELDMNIVQEKLGNGIGQITRIGGASTHDPVKTTKIGNQIQRYLVENTRLGVPALLHEESCAGAMILGGSIFPEMIGLASTFQPELAQKMTEQIRKQMMAIGARQALAPVLDVSRDPRWGRTEETFGEDPSMVSQFGVAYIKGLQGEDLCKGVAATGKHFVGHALSQGGMNCNPVHMGMQDVYDVYLPPFQAAIRDAKMATIMNAYPEMDGEVVAASKRILTDLLRGELGFDGLVVSDYEAVLMIHNFHYMTDSLAEAAKLALEAGIDVELPEVVCYGEPLKAALEAGDINMEVLDTAVERHLKTKFELGLFDNPYADEGTVLDVFETAEQRELARDIANRSMVLLKNDGLLPLKQSLGTLAVIGPNADNGRTQQGDYSYAATRELMAFSAPQNSCFLNMDEGEIASHDVKMVTVLEGIKQVAGNTKVVYAKGCTNQGEDRSGIPAAVEAAEQADVVVLVLGDYSGLTPFCTTGEFRDSADLLLPVVQRELTDAIIATGKPVVLVLINGRPVAMPDLMDKMNAVLEAWIPGEEGGYAVADVLFGKVNPGGKLPLTIPRHVGQLPIYYNHKPSGNKSHMFINYVNESVQPLYPFGFGLSYTTFAYADLQISKGSVSANEVVDISCKVTNSGKMAGDEIVQLYIRDEYASLPRPMKELKGFQRVSLDAGESKTIIFHLPVNQLAFYNYEKELIVEPGTIKVMIGSSSAEIHLDGSFEITEHAMIMDRVFVCPVDVNDLA
ncbi:MAG: glycoside hydrolase family 3 C-terminal domain-containing protein [Anaerolineaceae bacterium]|nr:glycoside hydrolase family 3 C-terminal domain-containing protein [Anaerolineaceae bacterium]